MNRDKLLINEPDDADAPEWARWKAQYSDGEWWWFESEPRSHRYTWTATSRRALASKGQIPAGHDWRKTLKEVKPMTTTPSAPTWPEDQVEVYDLNYKLTHQQRAAAIDTGDCADGVRCGFHHVDYGPVYCDDCPNRPQPQYNPDDAAFKQPRYQDAQGDDWIDEFARTATLDEFRGAMRFIIGKYNRRIGKKDDELQEVRKMKDYCERWEQYLLARR